MLRISVLRCGAVIHAENPAPAVIFFHGNAELIDYQDVIIRGYHRLEYSVLLP